MSGSENSNSRLQRPSLKFSEEVDEYTILTLEFEQYVPSQKELSASYTLLPEGADTSPYRADEKMLLRLYFVAWQKPYRGDLPGFRRDSPVFVICNERLVAGVYLCDDNELHRPQWGQLHYAFIDSSHSGRGIYSAIFREAVSRARRWGLKGLILTSDRNYLPEMYMRWGAVRLKTVRKGIVRKLAGKLWNLVMNNQRHLRASS